MEKITGNIFNFKEDENNFSTGFKDIDSYIKHVEKGSIITIGSRPAMGKTSFALSILNHLIEQDKKVFWFSPSSNIKHFAKRLIANRLGIHHFDFIKIDNTVKSGAKFYGEKELYVNDKTDLTVEDIENEIKENTPDVVFIDYIQLLKIPKAPNFTDSINLAVQEIKRIAQDTGVIFVLLTQLSRAVEQRCDKRPLLSDIRNSSLIEELSDVIMMIYRDEYYNRDDEYSKNRAEIIVGKNNYGVGFIAHLKFENGCFANEVPIEF